MEQSKLPKALELHTRATYDALASLGKPDPELDDALVVETRLTYLQKELDIPGTYYARIRAILFDGVDPCVVMLKRGTHGSPSVVALRHPPTAEQFADKNLTVAPHPGRLYLDATERIEKLEAWRDSMTVGGTLSVIEALRNHEARLAAIESLMAQTAARGKGETNGKNAQDTKD